MNQLSTIDEKLITALKTYAERHGYGALLDRVIRPVFPDWLRVVAKEKEDE